MKIEVKKLSDEEIEAKGIRSWQTWEKEVSRFDWQYETTEECYLLEGKVFIETENGEKVEFGQGDYVIFPKGLSCTWDIKVPVKKHYNFG